MNTRLQRMIDNGVIPNKGGVWIDAYNQCVSIDICGTITTRIDHCNHYWVTEPKVTNKAAKLPPPLIQPLVPWKKPGAPTDVCPTITTSSFEHNVVVLMPILDEETEEETSNST